MSCQVSRRRSRGQPLWLRVIVWTTSISCITLTTSGLLWFAPTTTPLRLFRRVYIDPHSAVVCGLKALAEKHPAYAKLIAETATKLAA